MFSYESAVNIFLPTNPYNTKKECGKKTEMEQNEEEKAIQRIFFVDIVEILNGEINLARKNMNREKCTSFRL